MELAPEQRKIIDLVNQLPPDLKKSTLEILSQMNASIDTTKSSLKETIIREAQEKDEHMIYFSIPDEKGCFKQLHAKNKMDIGVTYYKINTKTGEINYIPSTFDKRAINRGDSYLRPVCEFDYSHISDPRFSQIEIIEPGKVESSNDGWIITKKIKIKLN